MKKIKHLYFLLFFSTLLATLSAQTGTITGLVVEKSNNEPLIGATIRVEGAALGGMTDVNGQYTILNVPVGKHRIICSYISFTETTVEVEVKPKLTVSADFSMEYEDATLTEVIIVAKQEQQSAVAVLGLAQKSPTLVTGISQDDIRRSPDRNTGDILKRVSGTSVQDNKFVVIRGLADRYNASLLNGMVLTSTEPDRRAFAFDIFPGNLLDNLLVFKTAAPDMPGEFAGGIVQINTKEIPENGFWQLQLSTAYNMQSTGKAYDFYSGGKTDWLGYDDGTRALPEVGTTDEFNLNEDDPDKKYKQSLKFQNDWAILHKESMPMGFGGQLSTAQHIKIGGTDLGLIGAVTYNNTPRIVLATNANFNADASRTYSYDDTQSKVNVLAGGLLNFTYSINPRNRINFNNVLTVNSTDAYIGRFGVNDEQFRYDRANAMQYTSNKFYNGQLQGEHTLLEGAFKLNWGITYNNSSRNTPSLRRMFYFRNFEEQFEGDTLYIAYIPPGGPSPSYAGRFYSTQQEELIGFKTDISIPYVSGGKTNSFKIGGVLNTINRSFDARVFGYVAAKYDLEKLSLPQDQILSDVNINSDGFYVEESTNLSDSYEAGADQIALYGMLDHYVGETLRFTGGLRGEIFNQSLDSKTYGGTPVKVLNNNVDLLPSLNISYNINKLHKVRVAASQTVSRPNFRELAPFGFYDFEYQRATTGNPKLVRATIANFDLRYEFYPKPNQLVALGGFYKKFNNAIEQVIDSNTGSGSLGLNYANVEKANLIGAELEWRWKPFEWLTFFGNLALIQSKVDVSDISFETKVRPLQGQSPYVANTGLSFGFSKIGFNTTVLFNQIGRRIFQVGFSGFPDIYEAPRGILDWTITQRVFKNGEIKLSASDILNQNAVFYQDRNESGKYESLEDTRTFGATFGSNYSVALSYKF